MYKKAYQFTWEGKNGECLVFVNKCKSMEVKVWVLEETIFRVYINGLNEEPLPTWLVAPGMEDVPYEGRDRFDVSPFSCPHYKTEKHNNYWFSIYTSLLKMTINLQNLNIIWFEKYKGEWRELASDRMTQSYNLDGSLGDGIYHYMKRDPFDMYFGLGEKTGDLNRHGRRFRMKNMDPMGYDPMTTDPLYKHIPFYFTKTKDHQWFGLFYDNVSTSVFDMGKELDNYHGLYRYYHAERGPLDYYMIVGETASQIVETFSWLTGKTAFMPRWTLGYSGSTMTYTDAEDAQSQLYRFLDNCKKYDIACDSFQLSSGYTSIGDKRYVFNWNKSKFPSPKKFIQDFHKEGIRLCANIKPCLLRDHPDYKYLKENKLFILDEAGEEEEIVQFWDGTGAYIDFTNPYSISWWKNKIKEMLLDYGIDATWNDNNEFEIWNNKAKLHGFGNSWDVASFRPILSLLMIKASYEAQREFDKKNRPFLISRSGAPGMQRYAQTWTGDNHTSWKSLKYNIRTGIGLSLSGIYNFGHDVGGFSGRAPEPELFIRWIQNGILHPRFTIHSWNDDGTVNVPWMYPEYADLIKELVDFRVRIIPYLYQLLYEAYKSYKPIIRPLFYEFENDPVTFKETDDFMLGKNILVASVVEKGQIEKEVYLPINDKGWYDFHTGDFYSDGQKVRVPAPLNKPILFVQASSIIPIFDQTIHFNNKDARGTSFLCFPSQDNGVMHYLHYEDDGMTLNYREGEYTNIIFQMKSEKDAIHFQISKRGNYPLPYDYIILHLPESEKRAVYVNGEKREEEKSGYRISMDSV